MDFESADRDPLTHAVDVASHSVATRWRLTELATPTWTRTSVTTETKSNAAQPERHGGGLGMAFGTAVHRCIENMGHGAATANLYTFAGLAARDAGVPEAHVGEIVEVVQGVMQSALWQRSMAAKRRLFEMPFTVVERDVTMPTAQCWPRRRVPLAWKGTTVTDQAWHQAS